MRGEFDSRRDNLFLEKTEKREGEQCSGFYPTCTRMQYSHTALNCTVCHKKRMTISWKRKELHSPWSSSLNIMGQGVLMLAIALPHIPSWHMA